MKALTARRHLLRSGAAVIVAVAGLVTAAQFGEPSNADLIGKLRDETTASDVIALCGGVAFLLASLFAVRAATRAAGQAIEDRLGEARGAPLAFVMSVVGYLTVLFIVLELLGVPLRGLFLGGAITGIVVGIAAQQTLSNFFAGIVLMAVRPFTVGEQVVLRSGPLGGEYEGRITDMSFFYIDMITERGPVKLPNAGVLASAIGPGARSPREEEEAEEAQATPAEGGAPRT